MPVVYVVAGGRGGVPGPGRPHLPPQQAQHVRPGVVPHLGAQVILAGGDMATGWADLVVALEDDAAHALHGAPGQGQVGGGGDRGGEEDKDMDGLW